MDPLALKVAARFKVAESMGDPKELVREYEQVLTKLTQPQSELEDAKAQLKEDVAAGVTNRPSTDPASKIYAGPAIRASMAIERGWPHVQGPGAKLFLAILQSYALPAPLRKKIEIASRSYLKGMRPRYKAKTSTERYLEYIALYEKVMGMWREHLGYAKEAIAKGKEHSTEGVGATKLNVGPFTVVNTGGFSEKQMASVVEVVKKAVSFLQRAGFNEVCYGEIQVTNTLHKGTVWAFYMPSKDEMFVRANLKPTIDIVHNVIHELGHRYEEKFLKTDGVSSFLKRGPLWDLYHAMETQEVQAKPKDVKIPDPGTELENKGKTFVVTKTLPEYGKGLIVHLMMKETAGITAKVPLESFWALKGDPVKKDPSLGFVTNYAKKSPSENFAEMFAFFCMGKLSSSQKEAFERAIGKVKTASLIERVAARYAAR